MRPEAFDQERHGSLKALELDVRGLKAQADGLDGAPNTQQVEVRGREYNVELKELVIHGIE